MAEAEPCHLQSLIEGICDSSPDPHLLECPICLEQLQQPKSLPCLHSFCQECLGSYIIKESSDKGSSATSFSCPVCRRIIEPVNPSEAKGKWAEQFPTNNLVVEMIKLSQRTVISKTCIPCEKRGKVGVLAKFWCKPNNTFFCADCKVNYHDVIHEECNPEDLTNVNVPVVKSPKAIVYGCAKHNEKMEYYCEDHQHLICRKCIDNDHRKCEVVTSAEESYDKLRKSSKVDDLIESLHKCTEAMETLIKDIGEQLKTMAHDQETALRSLADLRRKIDTRFDTLQKEMTDKLVSYFKEEKENLNISIQKCERLKFTMQKTLALYGNETLKEDVVGTICQFQKGKAQVKSCEGLMQELENLPKTTIRISHKYDSHVIDINTKLLMGEIVVDKQSRNLPSFPMSDVSMTLFKRQLRLKRKLNIQLPSDNNTCSVCGIVSLPDSGIVVADKANKNVKLFQENGHFLCGISLTGKPRDVCLVDDHTVAVMLPPNTISVINIVDFKLKLLSEIKVSVAPGTNCYGITYCHDAFVIGTSKSVIFVTENGCKTKQHSINFACLHLATDHKKRHVFASIHSYNQKEVAVTRLSDGNRTDVLMNGNLYQATGIDVDRENNVYVCGQATDNVIQISEDGTHVRQLLTSSDGIKRPRAISVCLDRVLISSQSPDQQNTVHVFQFV